MYCQPGHPPAPSVGQVQAASAGTIGLSLAQEPKLTIFPMLVIEILQYNMEDTTRCYNTLPGWFSGRLGDMFPRWLYKEPDDTFIKLEPRRDVISKNVTKLANQNMI